MGRGRPRKKINPELQCHRCSKVFQVKHLLERHLAVHLGEDDVPESKVKKINDLNSPTKKSSLLLSEDKGAPEEKVKKVKDSNLPEEKSNFNVREDKNIPETMQKKIKRQSNAHEIELVSKKTKSAPDKDDFSLQAKHPLGQRTFLKNRTDYSQKFFSVVSVSPKEIEEFEKNYVATVKGNSSLPTSKTASSVKTPASAAKRNSSLLIAKTSSIKHRTVASTLKVSSSLQVAKNVSSAEHTETTSGKHAISDDFLFVCPECSMPFENKSAFNSHLVSHVNNYQYECDLCLQSFKYSAALKEHRKEHTKDRPFVCNECGKGFASLAGMNRHKFSHTSKKTYNCFKCDEKFLNLATRNKHAKMHLTMCHICKTGFLTPEKFMEHLEEVHQSGEGDSQEDIEDNIDEPESTEKTSEVYYARKLRAKRRYVNFSEQQEPSEDHKHIPKSVRRPKCSEDVAELDLSEDHNRSVPKPRKKRKHNEAVAEINPSCKHCNSKSPRIKNSNPCICRKKSDVSSKIDESSQSSQISDPQNNQVPSSGQFPNSMNSLVPVITQQESASTSTHASVPLSQPDPQNKQVLSVIQMNNQLNSPMIYPVITQQSSGGAFVNLGSSISCAPKDVLSSSAVYNAAKLYRSKDYVTWLRTLRESIQLLKKPIPWNIYSKLVNIYLLICHLLGMPEYVKDLKGQYGPLLKIKKYFGFLVHQKFRYNCKRKRN